MSGQEVGIAMPMMQIIEVLPGIFLDASCQERAKTYWQKEQVSPFEIIAAIVRTNDTDTMQHYLTQGGDINLRPTQDITAVSLLHHAAEYANLVMIKLFLAQGNLNLEIQDPKGETPIFSVLRRTQPCHLETHIILQAMLNKGANFRVKNHNNDTPMNLALKRKQTLPVFREIFDRSATSELFEVNHQFDSPLILALREGGVSQVKLVLARLNLINQAQLGVTDRHHRSLLQLATHRANPQIVTAVLEAYTRCEVVLQPADFARAWLGFPMANYQSTDQGFRERLKKTREVARLLFVAGAEINAVDPTVGMTPLMIMLEKGNWDLAIHWLNYHFQPEIDCNLICAKNWNALCYLIQRVKEIRPNAFMRQEQKINEVYQLLAARMSPEAIQHAITQMQPPMMQGDERQINFRGLIPLLQQPAHLLFQQAGHPQLEVVPNRIDLQSTHRREVHRSTSLCAQVLHARYAEQTIPTLRLSAGYTAETILSNSILFPLGESMNFMQFYCDPDWLSASKRKTYIDNLTLGVQAPIPGDDTGALRGQLLAKLRFINQQRTRSQEIDRQYLLSLYHSDVSSSSVEVAAEQRLSHENTVKKCLADWATGSVFDFFALIFTDNPYAMYQDPTSGLNLAQLFTLSWCAIRDPRYHLTEAEQSDLKVQMGLIMIDIMHEAGVSHSCAPGAFNALMDALAKSGYIPGLYVLSNAADSQAVKLQLQQKLSMLAQFEMLNAEQKITWFESEDAYHAALEKCTKEQAFFSEFGSNEVFKIFTEQELSAFRAELGLSWNTWVALHVDKRPTLEALTISVLSGMTQESREAVLSRKRGHEALEEINLSDLLEYPELAPFVSGEDFESAPKRRKLSDREDVSLFDAMDQSADGPDTEQAAKASSADAVASVTEDVESMMAQLDSMMADHLHLLAVGSGAYGVAVTDVDLDTLVDQIAEAHPALVNSQYDRSAIEQRFGVQAIPYALMDYTSQAEEIREQPNAWGNTHWNGYYMKLTQEALNQLLPQVGLKPIGNYHLDLRYYAERDLQRVLEQCSLNQADGSGKIICDQYAVWLENLVEQPELSPGMQA